MQFCYHCMHQIKNKKQNICPNCGKSLTMQSVSAKLLQPGTVLQGKYIIGYPLGSGGFGNTYIGWDMLLSRRVAIKEFFPKTYMSRSSDGTTVSVTDQNMNSKFRQGLRNFLEEARNVASLQDIPGVVAISGFFEECGTGYIVMEYLEGNDVRNLLEKSGGRLSYEQSRWIMLTVLDILRRLHTRGILHRDIAPDNVFVTKDGMIKLIDFGAARQAYVSANQGAELILKSGYSPIEQYVKNAPQGPYTDLYAAAALFYRMLTGQKPIPANERLEWDGLIRPSQMGIAIPPRAEWGMMTCLNVQPQYRFQSAAELADALEGRNFMPKYEADTVLSVPEKKRRSAAFPVIVSCICIVLLICSVCTGVFLVRNASDKGSHMESSEIVMMDLAGMTPNEVEKYISGLNKTNGWHIELLWGDTTFDLYAESGTVASQSVEPALRLSGASAGKGFWKNSDSSGEEEQTEELGGGLFRDPDGVVYGTITCTEYTNDRIRYEEIRDLNAYELAKKLNIDTDSSWFVGESQEGSSYYEILRLSINGHEISAEQLQQEDGEIAYKDGNITIIYSNEPFFYWKSLPDFKMTYRNVYKDKFQVYIWKNETDNEPTAVGSKALYDSNLVKADYVSLSADYCVGDVIEQLIPAGETFDASEGVEDTLLYTVGYQWILEGKTGSDIKKELEEWNSNITVKVFGDGDLSGRVESVSIINRNKKEVEYFKFTEPITVYLHMSESKATPTPPQPRKVSDGSITKCLKPKELIE